MSGHVCVRVCMFVGACAGKKMVLILFKIIQLINTVFQLYYLRKNEYNFLVNIFLLKCLGDMDNVKCVLMICLIKISLGEYRAYIACIEECNYTGDNDLPNIVYHEIQ